MRYGALFSGVVVALSAFSSAEASGYREFGKWTVSCDNGLMCSACGISDKDLAGERWGLRINRAPGYDGKIALRFNGKELSGEDTIIIDSKTTDSKTAVFEPAPSGRSDALPQERLLQVISRLLNAATMTLPGEDKGGEIVSLTGLKATLLFMDEQQGRIGALNAFVAKGDKKAAIPPPAYPMIKAARVPESASSAGIDLSAKAANAVMAYYRKNADRKMCDLGMERGSEEKPSAYPLQKGLVLVEVSCWRAAYQAGSVFYLYTAANGVVRDAPDFGLEQVSS